MAPCKGSGFRLLYHLAKRRKAVCAEWVTLESKAKENRSYTNPVFICSYHSFFFVCVDFGIGFTFRVGRGNSVNPWSPATQRPRKPRSALPRAPPQDSLQPRLDSSSSALPTLRTPGQSLDRAPLPYCEKTAVQEGCNKGGPDREGSAGLLGRRGAGQRPPGAAVALAGLQGPGQLHPAAASGLACLGFVFINLN